MDHTINQNTFYTGRMPVPFPKKIILKEIEFSIKPTIAAPQDTAAGL